MMIRWYSGNLDRIQIVKVWVDADGERHEKVFDVAWSGDRQPGADGKLPLVGNTVDVANATWTNAIGDPELLGIWKDPDFDPSLLHSCRSLVVREGQELAGSTRLLFPSATRVQVIGNGKYPPNRTFSRF